MKSGIEQAQSIQKKIDNILSGLDPFDIPIAGEVNDYSRAIDKVDLLTNELREVQKAYGLKLQYQEY